LSDPIVAIALWHVHPPGETAWGPLVILSLPQKGEESRRYALCRGVPRDSSVVLSRRDSLRMTAQGGSAVEVRSQSLFLGPTNGRRISRRCLADRSGAKG